MNSTYDILTAMCRSAPEAYRRSIATHVDAPESEINSDLRKAHFLTHVIYETTYLTHFVENLNYSPQRIAQVWPRMANRSIELAHRPIALGNAIYAGRFGNGDEASGDGFKFRGRGLLQHTFRNNYDELSRDLKLPLLEQPDKLVEPDTATQAAIFYFISRGCLKPADRDDNVTVTRLINGGLNGLKPRVSLENEIEEKEKMKQQLHRLLRPTPRGSR